MPGRQHEQRKSARKPKRQAAWISNDAGGCPIPCVLWDLSEGGARLAPARANVVPDVFTLLLTRDGKSHRLCRVAWRKKPYIGVCSSSKTLMMNWTCTLEWHSERS